jgi:hypothetical protein
MENMDNFRERFEALERQTKVMEVHTHTVERRLRWWRGIACGILVLALLSWTLPLNQARDVSAAKKRHEDNDHKNNDLEERLAALEDKLAAFTFDDANNEVVISGANLRIVNGLGSTSCTDAQGNPIPNCPNGLGNLIVGYNEERAPDGDSNIRTGSHNVVVGGQHNFSSFGGLVVGRFNEISGEFSSVSGGTVNTASGDFSSVSGGTMNTASGFFTSVSGGDLNTASGPGASVSGGRENTASSFNSSVSGGFQNTTSGDRSGSFASVSGGRDNTASGFASSVSGGSNWTAPAQFNWAAGALFSDQ